MLDQERLWNSRAGMGAQSGTRDLIAVELERRAIERHVEDGMRVLDVGCGNGETLLRLARTKVIAIAGVDLSRQMIDAALEDRILNGQGRSMTRFTVGDVLTSDIDEPFDLIYTQRMLINLGTWERQQTAIRRMLSWLKPGGTLLMVECSQDGLGTTNRLRAMVALPEIKAPSHNRYLVEMQMGELRDRLTDEGIVHVGDPWEPEPICSTYALLSRVVNAKLAMDAGTEPDYDSAVNRLALKLPNISDLGQNRCWRWVKTVEPIRQDRRTAIPDPMAPGDLD